MSGINSPSLPRWKSWLVFLIEELLRDAGYSLGRLSNGGLTLWKGVGQNESVDCVAIPEEYQEIKEMKNWGLA